VPPETKAVPPETTCLSGVRESAYDDVLGPSTAPPVPIILSITAPNQNEVLSSLKDYCSELFWAQPFRAYVAGGFIRDATLHETPRDLDVYIWNSEDRSSLEQVLRTSGWELERCTSLLTEWRNSGNRIVQIIGTDSIDARQFISRFDLTICCAALDLFTGELICSVDFTAHIASKRLVIHNPTSPLDTLRRVSQFMSRGYSITGTEMSKLHNLILSDMRARGIRASRFNDATV
jgi:hypothetical protein